MAGFRLYSTLTRFGVLTLLSAACAGCWEKIEYKGPRTTVASTPRAPQPQSTETGNPPETPPPAETPLAVVPETPAAEPPVSPPIASDTPAAAAVGDRYAIPAATDSSASASDQVPGITPAAEPPAATAPPVASDTPCTDHPPGITPSTGTPDSATTATSPPAPFASAGTPPPSDTAAASATEHAPPRTALNPRRAAWLLGSWLSLSALAHDRGVAAQSVPTWFEFSQKAAKFLGTTVPDLPEPATSTESAPASKQAVDYLLVNGQRIGRELAKGHGSEESALFEVALKSNILLVLYTPGSSAGDSIALAITQAAPKAKLPAELWQPVVDAIQKKASPADVRTAVQKLHTDADKYLTQPAEQKGQ